MSRSAIVARDVGKVYRRFLQPPYRFHLPESWLLGENPEEFVGDPGRVAEEDLLTYVYYPIKQT